MRWRWVFWRFRLRIEEVFLLEEVGVLGLEREGILGVGAWVGALVVVMVVVGGFMR